MNAMVQDLQSKSFLLNYKFSLNYCAFRCKNIIEKIEYTLLYKKKIWLYFINSSSKGCICVINVLNPVCLQDKTRSLLKLYLHADWRIRLDLLCSF